MSDSEQDAKTATIPAPNEVTTVIRSPPAPPGEAKTWSHSLVGEQGSLPVPSPGHTLAGRYMVFDLLGQGGMGVVLAAYDTRLDRRVAIKLPQAGAEGASVAPEAVARQEASKERPARVDWAGLLRRPFALDVFACVSCGGRLKSAGGRERGGRGASDCEAPGPAYGRCEAGPARGPPQAAGC
jgi:hypothetical protein